MPKQKSLKSFLHNYIIDSDKEEELRRSKTETDEKILRYVQENEEEDKRPAAADLIQEIQSHYDSLYAHYSHTTEEMKKAAAAAANISSSDSSDNSDSPRKEGEEKGLEEKVNSLLKELEIQNLVRIAWEDQCKKLESQSHNYCEELTASEKKVCRLEDVIEELRQELEMKVDDISTLVENLRTTEVKERLTAQKLRITEQLLGEKDEIHRQRVDKYVEEGKLLEEKNSGLVKQAIEKVQYTLARYDVLSMEFEDSYAQFERRVSQMGKEVRAVMKWISEAKVEKDRIEMENRVLLQQLEYGKEHELLLTAKIDERTDDMNALIQTTKGHEANVRKLKKEVRERDERLVDLGGQVKEKEDGIVSLSEEKREAIRHLCVSIDYHQNRYNSLRDMIMKKGGRRRPST